MVRRDSGENIERKGKALILPVKVYFLLLLLIIIQTGCTEYQYLTVKSNLEQIDTKEFIVENDTVLIKYSFKGENFPITVTLFNKLHQPVYIDLTRSTIVIDNFQVDSPFSSDQISFIAPLSYATIKSDPLRDSFITLNPKDSLFTDSQINNDGRNYSFSEKTSPVYFRSILAITTNEDYSYPTFFDYSFWVSDILQTFNGPKSIPSNPLNQFYIRKTTIFGKSAIWIGTLGLLILAIMVSGGE